MTSNIFSRLTTMRGLISFVCVFLLSFTLFGQNYRNNGSRNQTITTQRGSSTQQRSNQIRANQTRGGLTQQKSSQTGSSQKRRSSRGSIMAEDSQPQKNNVADNEITLVVSGEGKTKNEATASALRSAIEQAFGTFVSANTTLLNDDIVRDEIATVASGNIKSYKELSSVQNTEGLYNVSLSAVVSIGKLISYAQSHGSSAEFAGKLLAMNAKMWQLNKINERKALLNMVYQLRTLQDNLFDYKIQVKEPSFDKNAYNYKIPITLTLRANNNFASFLSILEQTLSSLSFDINDNSLNMPFSYFFIDDLIGKTRSEGFRVSNEEIKKLRPYRLRNEIEFLSSVYEDVCRILRDAQKSCIVRARGSNTIEWRPSDDDIVYLYANNRRSFYDFWTTDGMWRDTDFIFMDYKIKSRDSVRTWIYYSYDNYKNAVSYLFPRKMPAFFCNIDFFISVDDETLNEIEGFDVIPYPIIKGDK